MLAKKIKNIYIFEGPIATFENATIGLGLIRDL